MPERCYVKTAISVLNMGFMRGLSPHYMKATPAINDWLQALISADPTLQRRGIAAACGQRWEALASAFIERSGLEAADWFRRYFEAYLVPLVHCLYRYELAFMPHGENVILVLDNGLPVRAIMKDIAE